MDLHYLLFAPAVLIYFGWLAWGLIDTQKRHKEYDVISAFIVFTAGIFIIGAIVAAGFGFSYLAEQKINSVHNQTADKQI